MCARHPVKAFSLMELLVVIAIITILIAMIQPSMRNARETARDAQCRSQMHQIGNAFLNLSIENEDRLPGLWGSPWTGSGPLAGSFMGKEVFTGSYQPTPAAKVGTLVAFLGSEEAARQVYRCPSLGFEGLGTGTGSNGMFDYTMFQCFPGARVQDVQLQATYADPITGDPIAVPTPIILEEHPGFGINNGFIDMGHTSINRFATTHLGQSGNYTSIDGSGQRVLSGTDLGPEGWAWTIATGSGGAINLGFANNYGGW